MRKKAVFGLVVALALVSVTALAVVVKNGEDELDRLAFVDDRLAPDKHVVPISEVEAALQRVTPLQADKWDEFIRAEHGRWSARVDYRSGHVALAEGKGIPWIPGSGNDLVSADIAPYLRGRSKPDLDTLEQIARGFMPRVAAMLGVSPKQLVLNRSRSGHMGGYMWMVEFDLHLDGLPVEGAQVSFRVSNGSLIQFGASSMPRPGTSAPSFVLSSEEALAVVENYVGGFRTGDTFINRGTQHLVATAPDFKVGNGRPGLAKGYGVAAIWEFSFERVGVVGTWRARVDATTGELLMFVDDNKYASVTGGVYPVSFIFDDETILAMPFADLSTGGYSNSAGLYTYPGGTVTSTLNGQYVQISDGCGSISMSSDVNGDIAFGQSAGNDCDTPGVGGAGNTHAARMQFYHVNRAKEKGRSWLPSVTWLAGKNLVNVNGDAWCNAQSGGDTLYFYQSDTGCGNLGELAGVSLHELAHSLDTNDGNGFSPENGTGETYADFTAVLQTHSSCVGNGAFLGSPCGGYGDPCSSCDGVRDIDWANHSSGTPHTPLDLASSTGFDCPYDSSYYGPCHTEGHCESYISSEALWDFVMRDISNPGSPEAWSTMDRLWYLSRPTAGSAYTCNTSDYSSDGCDTYNYFPLLKAFDDDDSDLSNGTPHAADLFAAFDRHNIACGSASDPENQNHTGCTPPSAPSLNTVPANNQVMLSWTDLGAGYRYDVWRNELGCGSGFTRIADDLSTASYTDTTVANGYTYYYQITAQPWDAVNGTNEACSSAPSNCESAIPVPCTPPSAPTGVGAANNGDNRIDVSWNSVSGVTEYHVYRKADYEGSYTQVGTVTAPTTSYSDTTVSGGTGYTYVVRAYLDCESGNSTASLEVVATGSCLLPPSFGGADDASSSASATCCVEISWTAGSASCGSSLTYSVYRSDTSGFDPGVSSPLVSGLTGTSYTDCDGLINGEDYFYVVRATEQSTGVEETNTVEVSASPYGPLTAQTMYQDDFDGNRPASPSDYWLYYYFSGDDNGATELALNTSRSRSPSTSYKFGGAGTADYTASEDNGLSLGGDGSGVANGFAIPAGSENVKLRFWHTYEFGADDGAMLYYSVTGSGSGLNQVGTAAVAGAPYIESGGYNGNIGIPAWTGTSIPTFSEVVVNLDGVAGQTVWFLWRFYSNWRTNTVGEGYYLDDVTIGGNLPGPCTTGGSCTNPGAVTIDSITDNDPCLQDGVTINFSGGSGADHFDLYVDGVAAAAVNPFSSGSTYVPADSNPHSYVIQAVDGSCSTDSGSSSFTDAAGAPTAPVITAVNDEDGCYTTGVRVVYTASPEATSHDLYVDGGLAVSGYVSSTIYEPGNNVSHNYVVQAVTASCSTDSNLMAGTDAANPPGAPVITNVTDADNCGLGGIRVFFTAGSGASYHELWRDGSVVASPYASGDLYDPSDDLVHGYVVRAVSGVNCFTDSSSQNYADQDYSFSFSGIATATDVDACDDTGVVATWTAPSDWNDGSVGSRSYTVLRDAIDVSGAVAEGVSSYVDNTGANDTSFAYAVQATNGYGCTAGSAVTLNATDVVGTAPSFGGAQLVTELASGICGLRVSWNAATSNCGTAPGITYNVYRSTAPGFTPDAGTNLVASCVADLSFDDTTVSGGQTTYYVVRAEDSSVGHGGPCNGGFEESTDVEVSGILEGPVETNSQDPAKDPMLVSNGSDSVDLVPDPDPFSIAFPAASASVSFDLTHSAGGGASETLTTPNFTGTGGGATDSKQLTGNATISTPCASATFTYTVTSNYDNMNTPRLYFNNTSNGPFFDLTLPTGNGIAVTDDVKSFYDTNGPGTYFFTVVTTKGGANLSTFADISLTITGSGSGDATNCTRVSLVVPSSSEYILKPFGTAKQASYDVTGFYTGPGTYKLKLEESCSDQGSLSNGAMEVQGPDCDASFPNPVQYFTARSGSGQVKLEWQNPAGSYDSTWVCWSTSDFPTTPEGCSQVTKSSMGGAEGYATATHSGLTNGTTYYYSAFVDNGLGQFSARQTVAATPFDTGGLVKWAYHSSASALAPTGMMPGALGVGATYAVSNDRVLHGMNSSALGGDWPRSGSFSWMPLAMNGPSHSRPPVVPSNLFSGSPLVIFLGSEDGHAYAANGYTGEQLWQSPLLSNVLLASPTGVLVQYGGHYNLLFIGSRDATSENTMYALDPTTGNPVWSFTNGGGAGAIGIISSMAWPDPQNDRLYFTSRAHATGSQNTVWCLDFDGSGATVLWAKALDDVDGRPFEYQGRLYVGSNTGKVYALDAATGALQWTYTTTDGPVKHMVMIDRTALPGRKLYFSTTNTVWAIVDQDTEVSDDPADGAWQQAGIDTPSSPLVPADGAAVYVGSGDGSLYQLDPTDGTVAASQVIGDGAAAVGSPAIDVVNDMCYLGTESGSVYGVMLPLQ